MLNHAEPFNKIEVLSEGAIGRPTIVRIGQQDYVASEQDPNTILLLEDVAQTLLLKDLPAGIGLTPCKRIQILDDEVDTDWEFPILPSRFEGIAPFRIYNLGNGKAGVILSWYCTKGFWNEDYGYRWKLQRARTAALSGRKALAGIRFHRFFDHGYLAGVEFEQVMTARSLETVMKNAYETSQALHAAIEESLKPKTDGSPSEAVFVKGTLIPLLKQLGFKNVVFHHGPREFGRDVLFSRQTEFGAWEYWAAQVKLGNVSGRSNSFIDLIVNQAQEAFKIPLLDIHTKSKVWISKFVVAISGRFTENAVEKICEKIESHSQKNNIIFLDGEKIQELAQGPRPLRRPRS